MQKNLPARPNCMWHRYHAVAELGIRNHFRMGQRCQWREYWGEMGHVRVAFGALDVESQCAWAMVQSDTATELNNHEGGDNCGGSAPSLCHFHHRRRLQRWACETVRGETVVCGSRLE